MQCAYANRCVFFQETKSGALKKTSRYRSRSLSASSTDSYSSGEKQIHLRRTFGSFHSIFACFTFCSIVYGQQLWGRWCIATWKNPEEYQWRIRFLCPKHKPAWIWSSRNRDCRTRCGDRRYLFLLCLYIMKLISILYLQKCRASWH